MEKYNNWKLKFYTIWAGQAVSLITSAILQMAIIFYLTEKTGSAMVLSMASLVGFLPYAVFGPAIGVLVDRHDRKKIMIGADFLPLDSFTKQLIHPVSKTDDIHRASQQFFQFIFQMGEREKPLRLTLVINVHITAFRLLITSYRAKDTHFQDSVLFAFTNLEVS